MDINDCTNTNTAVFKTYNDILTVYSNDASLKTRVE